jgi:hypothetical protein
MYVVFQIIKTILEWLPLKNTDIVLFHFLELSAIDKNDNITREIFYVNYLRQEVM